MHLSLSLFLCCAKWRASIRMVIWDLISIWMVFRTNPILLNWNWILMDALTCIVQTMRTVSLEILRPMANMIISQRCFYSVVLFISIIKFSRIEKKEIIKSDIICVTKHKYCITDVSSLLFFRDCVFSSSLSVCFVVVIIFLWSAQYVVPQTCT